MISIIVVNYRTPDDLCRLLASLKENPPRDRWEIIVVDNASGDDSAGRARAEHPDVRVIESPANRGFAAGVNLGLAEAHGDRVLLLNPDIVVRPGSIDALAGFLDANPGAGLVAARLHNPDGSLQYTCRTYYTLWTILLRRTFLGHLFPKSRALRDHMMYDYDHAAPREVDWVSGACMMVRRQALEEVGPMDERYFMYFEDVDWCTRMHRRGWGVWYVPDSVMTHGYRRASARGFGRTARAHAGSLIRFWEKWSAVIYLLRRNRGLFRTALLLLVDIVAITAAFLLAFKLRDQVAPILRKPTFALSHYRSFLVMTNVAALAAFAVTGMYREGRRGDSVDTLFASGKALLYTCVALLAATFVFYTDTRAYSRFIILSFWPLALVTVTTGRRLIGGLFERARRGRINVRRAALIGRDPGLDALARTLRQDPVHGVEPIRLDLPSTDRPQALRAALANERVSDVIFSMEALPAGGVAEMVNALREAGLTVHFSGPLGEILTPEVRVERLAGQTFLTFERTGGAGASAALRGLFDRAVAAILAIVYLLPAILTWLPATLAGRRPRLNPDTGGWTARGRVGRWLVWSSLDRYPGYFAVLAGRIRLVGSAGGRGLFSADWPVAPGRIEDPAADPSAGAGHAVGWSAENDLKTVVRSILGRLKGLDGMSRPEPEPLLTRSHRSALR